MSKRGIATVALAALLLGAMPAQAQRTAPPPRPAAQQQQTQRLQQQLMQMQQHMQQLRERIQVVDQDLDRTMDRIRDRDQLRDQDRDRLRDYQALRELCNDLGATARQVEQNADRLRETTQNRLFQDDAQLRREAERLRERYRNMAHEMEQSVQALERMQNRLGQITEEDPS